MVDGDALEEARQLLARHLPPSWSLRRDKKAPHQPPERGHAVEEARWGLRGPGDVHAAFLVQRRPHLSKRHVADLRRFAASLATAASDPQDDLNLLLTAPWIAATVRDELSAAGISYIDDSGNMRVVVRHLPVLIASEGSQTNPRQRPATRARLSGDAALAVVRYLIDVEPPYSPAEIVEETALSGGYVSKLLSALEEATLIERQGPDVVSVNWVELLRERAAQAPSLLGEGRYIPMLAREGLPATLDRLQQLMSADGEPLGWVTGSAAARRLAPLAPTTQLTIWTEHLVAVRKRLGLLPAADGPADVLLLTRNVEHAVWGARVLNAVPYVAPSQIALDCLTGNGRMPAEGEAVIAWMAEHEARWRQRTRPVRVASSAMEDTWTPEWAKALLDLLSKTGPTQAAVIRAAAGSTDGSVSRERTYKIARFDLERSLRGFTRPVNSAQSRLVRRGTIPPLLAPALQARYEHGVPRASGFAVPRDLAKAVRALT